MSGSKEKARCKASGFRLDSIPYLQAMWVRRRTVVAGRTDGDNDWTVYKDRQPVGRVYATHISDPALKRMWVVQIGPVGQGYAPDLPEALEEIRRRFG